MTMIENEMEQNFVAQERVYIRVLFWLEQWPR